MGKNSRVQINCWVSSSEQGSRWRRCLSCKRQVVYGDGCQDCRDKLRLRRKRKPR